MPCLSHISALECLRDPNLYATIEPAPTRAFKETEPGGKRALSQGEFSLPDCVSTPCHMLVAEKRHANSTGQFVQHLNTRSLPEGSFLRIDRFLLCSSPECCFLQMASYLSITELVWLGSELCSDYSILKDRYIERSRLTSARKLSTYIHRCQKAKGIKRARRALKCIVEGAASPSEAALALLATLPLSLGGYALPRPTLNGKVNLSKHAQIMAGKKCYKCDLLWAKEKLDLEYDSDSEHTGSERIAEDAIRRNLLKSEKSIDVIVVTNRQLRDPVKFHYLMKQTSKALGLRLRPKNSMAMGLELDLREILFRHEHAANRTSREPAMNSYDEINQDWYSQICDSA